MHPQARVVGLLAVRGDVGPFQRLDPAGESGRLCLCLPHPLFGQRDQVLLRRWLVLSLPLPFRPVGEGRRTVLEADDQLLPPLPLPAILLRNEIRLPKQEHRFFPSAALTFPCSPSVASTSRKWTRMGSAAAASSGRSRKA